MCEISWDDLGARRKALGKSEEWATKTLRALGAGDVRAAYSAALDAAERAQAEPVCPEGVTVAKDVRPNDAWLVAGTGVVAADGMVTINDFHRDRTALRYLVDLADYRARLHADGDRQRKLDAVRAAEEAYLKAEDERRRAEDAADQAARALGAARREAGL